jgi:Skp family chaperone for outer membrane proteins
MIFRPIPLAAALGLCLAFSGAAFAQSPQSGPAKIAVVNPSRIFSDMQETKDYRQKLEAEQQKFLTEKKDRETKLKDLQSQRDLLKPDSPQYSQANDNFMKEAIDYDTWSKITVARLEGEQKQQTKSLFEKIVQVTQEVAQQRGIDVVIADQRPPMPDNLAQVNVQQLQALLASRNILYVNSKVDISQDVIAALDAKYRAGGNATGATTAPPAPAPAPAQ